SGSPSGEVLRSARRAMSPSSQRSPVSFASSVNGTPEPCLSVRWSPRPDGVLVDGAPVLLGTSGAQCLGAALVPQGAVVVTAGRGGGVVCR
ncbi:hypothetical protein, partial [Streptomyces zhihengii]